MAACAQGRITDPSMHVLRSHNVRLLTVGATKDAADEALLAEAKALAHKGCRRFVVASNDSIFAQLADLGTLEIVVWKTQKTRPCYSARASRVHRLQCPPITPTPRIPAPVPIAASQPMQLPSPATFQQGTSDPVGQRAPRVQRSASQEALRASAPVHLGATGLGLLTAGMIFGVGAAIGDLVVQRTVQRRGEYVKHHRERIAEAE